MTTPYEKKVENVAGDKKAQPQAAIKYSDRKKSLLKFVAIFFAVMAIGTFAVTILLKAN